MGITPRSVVAPTPTPRREPRPVRRYTAAQTDRAVVEFVQILQLGDELGQKLYDFTIRSLRSRASIVVFAETLVECVGIERQCRDWRGRAWEHAIAFRADMKSAAEVKDEAEIPEGRVQKLTREEGNLLIAKLSPIFGAPPTLGEEPPRPGIEPKDKKSKEHEDWHRALRARERWLFIRNWTRNFPNVVIGDGRNSVMTSMKLVELMLDEGEWEEFQNEMKAARAAAAGSPAPEEAADAEEGVEEVAESA